MTEPLLLVIAAALLIVLVLQFFILKRSSGTGASSLLQRLEFLERGQERAERTVREELAMAREESARLGRQLREEIVAALNGVSSSNMTAMGGMITAHKSHLESFSSQLDISSRSSLDTLEKLKAAVEERLETIRNDNARNLEQIRLTVDEKLQGTLEKRLGESFRLVSERLELVHKGLGEMQTLASGVGDLKKVLTNVKTRGTWGEVQLGMLLEQVLTPEQFAKNLATKDGGERVEFGVRLPGQGNDPDDAVWLPIDAKFPVEDYQRLEDARERGESDAAEAAGRQLEQRVRSCAADIFAKYINPPVTTDFAILFLPTEGLFAETVRRSGLTDAIQRDYRVVIAGPTTLWSILNSLQMGFRTLAIQRRSGEVWSLLAAVKTEWTKYADALDAVQKKLNQASDTIEKAKVRSRAVGRKLKDVQELPSGEIQELLPPDIMPDDEEDGRLQQD